MNICPRTLQITATNEKYCDENDSIIEVSAIFTDSILNNEIIETAEEAARGHFYDRFDKGPYKITEIEDVSINW